MPSRVTRFICASLLVAVPAAAQSTAAATDPRWTPYVGCWRLAAESAGAGDVDATIRAAMGGLARTVHQSGALVCVTPGPTPAAVTQKTVINGTVVLEETVAADGTDRSFTEKTCRGTQSAEWSASGHVLFSRATLTCDGQAEQKVSGITLLTPGPLWVQVQAADAGGRRSVRVRRYGRAADQDQAHGISGAGPGAQDGVIVVRFALEEVIEASKHASVDALEAAILETAAPASLKARDLVALDDADVPDSVIDLIVAMAYPRRFRIDRAASASYGGGPSMPLDPWMSGWGVMDPYDLLSLYAPFGYYSAYPYYLSRFSPYYPYYPWAGYGWAVVNPGPVGGTAQGTSLGGAEPGRVVNGAGYTRVRPREAEPAHTAGGVNGTSGEPGGGSGSSNSGGSTGVSGSGYSGGGASGGNSGRTAVPRPPGGDR
jgi:hypothetical protein